MTVEAVRPRGGIAATAQRIREGSITALSLIEDRLARIERLDPALNCFTAVMADRARREAAAVDANVRAGRDPGPLAGVPFGAADNYDLLGRVTTAGSAINRRLPPATADAVLVRRLARAGAVLVGAQNMDEFACGFTTENPHNGPTRNPLDPERSAGGSSGGAAASIAAGLADFALGTDCNGSIRIPASFCGVFAMKPTFGRLPRSGIFPLAQDLDHAGLVASSACDLGLIYDAIQGHDADDLACAQLPESPTMPHLDKSFIGRVGVLGGWFEELADDQGREAAAQAADLLGAEGGVELATAAQARAAAVLLACASGGNLHFANLATRPDDFDPAVRDRLLAGTLLPAHFIMQAQRFRTLFREQVLGAFRRYDLLLAPATPCPAPLLGQATVRIAGRDEPTRANLGLFTEPLSLIGLPIVAVPVPGDPLPMAVQIIAPPWREDLALAAAAHLERAGLARSTDPLP